MGYLKFLNLKQILGKKWFTVMVAFFGLLIGLSISSFYWQNQLKDAKNKIDYKQFEIGNLEEQIASLRKDQNVLLYPSPKPAEPIFVPKESFTGQNAYKLSCFGEDEIKNKKVNFEWLTRAESKLTDKPQIISLCYNKELNEAAIITQKQGAKGDIPLRPGDYKYEFLIYSISNDNIRSLEEGVGSYLGGLCQEIKAWTKTGNIYYECRLGEGPTGESTIFKMDVSTKQKGIAEQCYSILNDTSCTNFCESSKDCSAGYVCNLEKSYCVKPCSDPKDCPGGACQPLGTIMACTK